MKINLFIAIAVRSPRHLFSLQSLQTLTSTPRSHGRKCDFTINLFSFFYLLIARSDGLFVYCQKYMNIFMYVHYE